MLEAEVDAIRCADDSLGEEAVGMRDVAVDGDRGDAYDAGRCDDSPGLPA
jgi:hypothetical protein